MQREALKRGYSWRETESTGQGALDRERWIESSGQGALDRENWTERTEQESAGQESGRSTGGQCSVIAADV